jgi:uncharacterized protein YrzB (UPF0473 family)
VDEKPKKPKQWKDKDRVNVIRADAMWDIRLADAATKLIAAGFTYEDIGVVLGVTGKTVANWSQKYKSFNDAAKDGHAAANAITLAQMLRSAWGYDYQEKDEKFIALRDEEGNETGKHKVVTIVKTRHQPPNADLIKFIALNRMSNEFKDAKRIEIEDHKTLQITGSDEIKALDDFIGKFLASTKPKQIESRVVNAGEDSGQSGDVATSCTEGNNPESGIPKGTTLVAS